ncbi:MAG: 5,6-dimethylbenzimidazole synthase [Actinomycetota bacterium]|nr:5,6-dimethylbenzimidazole synthase [Actinomycetota bacterium]
MTGRWARPEPLVGDTTSAADRAAAPAAWRLDEGARAALYEVIGSRRDVRRFRSDPVEAGILRRVLEAAHQGPSVGHSQPWRFVVVRAAETRERAALLADRQRLGQASRLEEEAGRQMLDLTLEGIREAPVGIVVCCDRRTPPAGVLGRATFVDADLWSCACAIENLWLAARAEGLGVGWVTLFEPAELAGLVGLPPGVEPLGWLCVGWPDERPPVPGLETRGWSKRMALEEVVMAERFDEKLAGPPRSRLRSPAPEAVVAAHDDADELLSAPGSLGVLDRYLDRLTAAGIDDQLGATLVLAGADHPVARLGVSTFSTEVTAMVLAATLCGESLGAAFAVATGAEIVAVDAGVDGEPIAGARLHRPRRRRGDLAHGDALDPSDVESLLEAGRAIGAEIRSPVVALGEVGIGNTTVAAALATILLDLEVPEAVGLGVGGDSDTIARKAGVVAAAVARARAAGGPSNPLTALSRVGGPEFALLCGVVLGAAARNAIVVLDGYATSVAAICAVQLEPGAASALVAGQRSREQAHRAVLSWLGLEPLLDLRLRAGEGVGALLAAQMLRAGLAARRRSGRTRAR